MTINWNSIATPIRHALSHPYLLTLSIAALWHSSWAFAVFFTGKEPAFGWAWAGWYIPGFLLAFSTDIGLLSYANQMRADKGTRGTVVSFIILCITMAYLQFLYISTHLPLVDLGEGVRHSWVDAVAFARDCVVFVFPLFLPLTLAANIIKARRRTEAIAPVEKSENDVKIENAIAVTDPEIRRVPDGQWYVECSQGDFSRLFPTEEAARRSLSGHRKVHAVKALVPTSASANGHGGAVAAGEDAG